MFWMAKVPDNNSEVYDVEDRRLTPQEQVNEIQANLLGAAFELAIGGPTQIHVGTGGGGSSSELPWGEQKNRSRRSK